MVTLPHSMLLKDIVTLAKDKLGISTVRVVGDPDQECRKIYLAFGYMDGMRQIEAIQKLKPDLILSGETREWETVERVRDGLLMGQKTSLLVLSHAVSEEAGMEYAAKWLEPRFPASGSRTFPPKIPLHLYSKNSHIEIRKQTRN